MNIKKLSLTILIPFFCITVINSRTIYVSPDLQFKTLQSASAIAEPGDIIIIKNGTYFSRENIVNLNGSQDNPIIIHAEDEGKVIYSGQSEAWHLSSCSYLYITGFVFEKQTANGVNIDDSGNLYGSAHHITIKNCTFRDMNASGNNDLLKLSGLEDFIIENCIFSGGSAGGSGIDMVGCHNGKITGNRFENLGSSGIQAKGGSQYIEILQNKFINAGNRALNLGGSTDLAFFRPPDAKFEAADILVQSNIFEGSWSPVAFVGSIRVRVINNTIFNPENWVLRILQETVDPSRFVACGNNEFSNNIIYFGNNLSRIVNTGPDTAPETFSFSNNLWYNYQNNNFNDTQLPVVETNAIIQKNPLFIDSDTGNYELAVNSPATGKGKKMNSDVLDFKNRYFYDPPSIGAFESSGIYKDFTGNIGDKWYYNYDYGYIKNTIINKDISANNEVSEIERFVHVGDATGVIGSFQMLTSGNKTTVKLENLNFPDCYDFTLLKGDTLNKLQNDTDYMSFIDSVKYEYIAGIVRKVLYTHHIGKVKNSSANLYFGHPGKLIEGIFSIKGYLLGKPNTGIPFIDSTNLRCYIYTDSNGDEKLWKFTDVECDKASSSVKENLNNKYMLYPNPTKNQINLEFELISSGVLELLDLNGEILLSKKILSQKQIKIDLQSFKSGLYILKYISDKTALKKKIIIVE